FTLSVGGCCPAFCAPQHIDNVLGRFGLINGPTGLTLFRSSQQWVLAVRQGAEPGKSGRTPALSGVREAAAQVLDLHRREAAARLTAKHQEEPGRGLELLDRVGRGGQVATRDD